MHRKGGGGFRHPIHPTQSSTEYLYIDALPLTQVSEMPHGISRAIFATAFKLSIFHIYDLYDFSDFFCFIDKHLKPWIVILR